MVEGLQPGDPERAGSYRLLGRLGNGGMGRVFLGRSAGGRPVAVKVIRAELAGDREFRARFRRETAPTGAPEAPTPTPRAGVGRRRGSRRAGRAVRDRAELAGLGVPAAD
jgi:hypothetical protein